MGSILAVGFLMNLVLVLFFLVSLMLILIVLIQKGKGGGLSGAFGGAGGAGGLLGSKTGDFLTWVTVSVAALFLILAVLLARYYRPAEIEDVPVQPIGRQTVPEDVLTEEEQEFPLEEQLPQE